MTAEDRKLWKVLLAAGEAIQNRLIGFEYRNRKRMISANRKLSRALRSVKKSSKRLQITVHCVHSESRENIYTYGVKGNQTGHNVSLHVHLIFGSGARGRRQLQKGDITIIFLENGNEQGYKPDVVAQALEEREQLTSAEETRQLLGQFGLIFGN